METIVAKWNRPNNQQLRLWKQKELGWNEEIYYEYLKENTRYSVLFGMDSTLNLTMCSAWFYLRKRKITLKFNDYRARKLSEFNPI